jgi:putative FmdB family regulatory protein
MPSYTFICNDCKNKFELFLTFAQYSENQSCTLCDSNNTNRSYADDLTTISGSVVKSDGELKLGDLANRNRDKLSQDEKEHLHHKHNAYKDPDLTKQLPKGMTRLKKQPKIQWPK